MWQMEKGLEKETLMRGVCTETGAGFRSTRGMVKPPKTSSSGEL